MISLDVDGRTVTIETTDDHIGRVLTEDWYERDLLRDIRNRIPRGVAIDVGAHIGVHALWMSVVCGLPVIAIEPWRPSYDLLSANVARNQANVETLWAAAGRTPGWASVAPPPPDNTGAARTQYGDGEVRVLTLDSLVPDPVSVIKVDVEGAEVDVLAGAVGILERDRPVVYTEANDMRAQARLLTPLGYRVTHQFRRFTPRLRWEAG